ncbi:hypothetical protein LEP1GSC151_1797 [Leptospira interrogans serovar Grippotyphosa str. LT2186]|uniref:Uncharacterized protein n=1 Tax=Leptospira interrogans serovar Grippotyphosa str. LT2186 TaxID=1001599 RepID=M3HYW2_LEPIR|nr:hypothetical protein LEP1GSC151_1797 [Leptospira interrogans serovar Grippotyphosa str. LT2186]
MNRILESKAQKGTFFKCSDKNESFYLQKVCFSDIEKFSEPYRLHPKIGKTQHNGSLRIALETQHNGSLRIALETQHNALYESRCGAGTKFYRRFCRNSDDRS